MSTISEAFDLSGRVAIVTGAGRGLGRAMASRFAEAGATAVCADIDGDSAAETASLIGSAGGTASARTVDVTRRTDLDDLVAGVVDEHGHLDVMVNNAAIIVDGLVLDTSEDDLDRVLAVNFKGVFFGCQAAGRVMVDQRSGSIINMASGAIDIPTPALVCYATAKAAVAQLSRTLAMELAPHQVRVNAIAPGWIDTPMNERHARRPDGTLDEEKHREYIAMRAKLSPMGIPGEPDDIAFAALYLAAPAARFVTGIVMRPNGGATMPLVTAAPTVLAPLTGPRPPWGAPDADELEAPTHEYHGVAFGTGRAPLFPSARPLGDDVVRARFPTPAASTARWHDAVDALVTTGALRPEDAPAMKARSDEVSLPHALIRYHVCNVAIPTSRPSAVYCVHS